MTDEQVTPFPNGSDGHIFTAVAGPVEADADARLSAHYGPECPWCGHVWARHQGVGFTLGTGVYEGCTLGGAPEPGPEPGSRVSFR